MVEVLELGRLLLGGVGVQFHDSRVRITTNSVLFDGNEDFVGGIT